MTCSVSLLGRGCRQVLRGSKERYPLGSTSDLKILIRMQFDPFRIIDFTVGRAFNELRGPEDLLPILFCDIKLAKIMNKAASLRLASEASI